MTKLIKDAVAANENFILIVTAEHERAIRRKLDLEEVQVDAGQLTILNAEALLPQVAFDDNQIDTDLLASYLSQWLEQAKSCGRRRVRGFGEMVSLLRLASRFEASERLEAFWSHQAEQHPIAVHCGYVDDGSTGAALSQFLAQEHEVVYRDSSRERLIQAARELFARSYAGTTTAAIARRAGSSESQMVKYFGSKEGLLLEVFEAWWEDLFASIESIDDPDAPPRLRLDRTMHCMIETFRHDQQLSRVLLFEGWTAQRGGQGPMVSEGRRHFMKRLLDLLQSAEERGELTHGLTPTAACEALVGAIEGMVRALLLSNDEQHRISCDFKQVGRAMTMIADTLVAPPE